MYNCTKNSFVVLLISFTFKYKIIKYTNTIYNFLLNTLVTMLHIHCIIYTIKYATVIQIHFLLILFTFKYNIIKCTITIHKFALYTLFKIHHVYSLPYTIKCTIVL